MAKLDVAFGEEVARPARRIEYLETRKLVLERPEQEDALLLDPLALDLRELGLQIIEKERVDHLVDVLDAGVVHAASTSRLRIQGALERRTEDGGADAGPIELLGGLPKKRFLDLLGELRNDDVLALEQVTVDIGKGSQPVV